MPIYEYYCPDNHRIYQFYAKTIAQGRTTPRCPADPAYRMLKLISAFAVGGNAQPGAALPGGESPAGEKNPRLDAAMGAMEREFAQVDENDPRAMGRMMRRMAELSGEKIDGDMEEVVRKLEEGADPDALDNQFPPGDGKAEAAQEPAIGPARRRSALRSQRAGAGLRGPAARDPRLYDYE